MNDDKVKNLKYGTIFTIVQIKNSRNYTAMFNGIDYSDEISLELKEKAFAKSIPILYDNGFKLLPGDYDLGKVDKVNEPLPLIFDASFIHKSPQYRPDHLIMSDLHWKFLVRNVIKGKNILMAGYTGAGKTTFAKGVATLLKRPFFKIPLGSSQDPRATLIGSTFFHKDKGTVFIEAEFVRAIQTKNAVILLDEYTRAHPDAENILMTVLDHQRYLKLDEHEEQITIQVAEGVCFIATANFGNEFTTTRTLDRATLDRFLIIEMALLTETEEYNLLCLKFPKVNRSDLSLLTKLTSEIRKDYTSGERKYGNMVSTRMCEEIAEALEDGFTLPEALEVTVLPLFNQDGDTDSERTIVKMLIDSILPVQNSGNGKFPKNKISPDNMFGKKAGLI